MPAVPVGRVLAAGAAQRASAAAVLVAVITASGCSPANGNMETGRPPSAAVSADSRITMQRLPCFGTCPVYTVDMTADGTVTFTGERFVDSTGTRTTAIESADATALVEEMLAQGIFEFADRYTYDAKECGLYHTDAPGAILTLRTGGRTKSIEHDYGCSDAPAELREMHERFDSVAGVQRWIGRGQGPPR